MQASQQFRKVTQGTIRKRIGAAKTKLKELQSRLCNATTQKDKMAYRAQVERAKQHFYAANAERQRQNMLRRRHVARQEEKKDGTVNSATSNSRTIAHRRPRATA
jgi:hypothetical protein